MKTSCINVSSIFIFEGWVEKAIQMIRGIRWKDTVNARSWVVAKQCKSGLTVTLGQQVTWESRMSDQGASYHEL